MVESPVDSHLTDQPVRQTGGEGGVIAMDTSSSNMIDSDSDSDSVVVISSGGRRRSEVKILS
eukprot:scaffold1453_cov204-Ochromonas_danica.AAC.5